MRKLGFLLLLLFPLIASAASRTPEVTFFRDGNVNRFAAPIEGGRARVIVEFTSTPVARSRTRLQSQSATRSTLERFRRDLASKITTNSSSHGAVIEHEYVNSFSGAAVTLDESTLAHVRSLSYVQRVSYDVRVRASIEPGIAGVRAPEVWSALATRGAGVTVAIIDTGIDYMHSSLGGGFGPGFKVIGGYDFVNKDDDPMDDVGHGTHVAGIVAANSTELLGVAPDAQLVAFKVLDENGSGWMTDIIAAIERCIDPNGDGDFSDRVDIANMSLGGTGSPEDEMSRAVDAAVEAGVVFAIAAGNAGMPQTIGSPGTAERAITVGATMPGGAIAMFSSRGPNPLHYSIKPDVVAPGGFVRSAQLGGGLVEHSGTSMASPHVAGVAALLRALHPDWSADRIKSAIVSTAQGETQSVMAVGGGSVDAFRAANAVTEVQPPSLSFGVTDGTTPSYSRSITVTITNHGDSARTYTANMFGAPAGIVFDTPATFTLAPKEARLITITMQLDHTRLGFPENGTFAFDGLLEIQTESEHVRVPWAVAKGVRVHLAYTESDHWVIANLWQTGKGEWPLTRLSPNAFESLAIPGVYDLTVVALPFSDELEPAVMYFEQQSVLSDRRFDLGYFADAPYVTAFAPHDEAGVPLTGFPEPGGCISFRTLEFSGNRGIQFFSFEPGWRALRTNALNSTTTLFANDFCLDPSVSRFYGIHYEPVHGVSESLRRDGGGNALIGQKVDLRIPGPVAGQRVIEFGAEFYLRGNPGGFSAFFGVPYESRRWSGLAYVTPENEGNVRYPPMLAARSEGAGQSASLGSAVLRVIDGKVTTFAGSRAGLTTDYGETISIGAGAVIPQLEIERNGAKTYLGISVIGQLEEPRRPGIPIGVALFDEFGGELLNNGVFAEVDNLDRRVTLKAEGETHEIDGALGRSWLTTTFGGPQEDKLPPALTSMLLRDGSGRRIIERVQRDVTARVMFAVSDDGLIEGKTSLRVRNGQFGEWIAVPIVVKGYDERRGTIYEGELPLHEKGHYDLEVTAEDASGNSTVALMSPVLAVVDGKARAVRH